MRVSKNFLNDYVKVDDLDFHELAEKWFSVEMNTKV